MRLTTWIFNDWRNGHSVPLGFPLPAIKTDIC